MSILATVAFALATSALAAPHQPVPALTQELPKDERILEAWSYLTPAEKGEVTEWFRAEVSYLDTTQNKLIAYLEEGSDRDRGEWPTAEPTPFFDPSLHAPAQPIARHRLDPESKKAIAARARFAPQRDPMQRAWVYDWTTGGLLITRDERDAELLFHNGMLGLPPQSDLAEALLLQRLDDGSEREILTAFAHAYTDRTGTVYPGITLFDAWGSGSEMEMPDVDVLGVIHTVRDDWKSFTAPIPPSKQKKAYTVVGDLFLPAFHYRRLREAVAANYLRGKAIPADTYAPNILALNALWEEASGVPEELAKELPKTKNWDKYMKSLTKKVAKKKSFREAGQNRVDWFEGERYLVKAKLIWVMQEFGAFDRKALPK
jgi:hypothetical protein